MADVYIVFFMLKKMLVVSMIALFGAGVSGLANAVSQADYEACKAKKCKKGSPNYDQCKKDCGYNGN